VLNRLANALMKFITGGERLPGAGEAVAGD
jgi:hypothetical protein